MQKIYKMTIQSHLVYAAKVLPLAVIVRLAERDFGGFLEPFPSMLFMLGCVVAAVTVFRTMYQSMPDLAGALSLSRVLLVLINAAGGAVAFGGPALRNSRRELWDGWNMLFGAIMAGLVTLITLVIYEIVMRISDRRSAAREESEQ